MHSYIVRWPAEADSQYYTCINLSHFSMSVNSWVPLFMKFKMHLNFQVWNTSFQQQEHNDTVDFAAKQRYFFARTTQTGRTEKCLFSTCLILNFLSDRTARHVPWETNVPFFLDIIHLTPVGVFFIWHCLSYRNVQEETVPSDTAALSMELISFSHSFSPTSTSFLSSPLLCLSFILWSSDCGLSLSVPLVSAWGMFFFCEWDVCVYVMCVYPLQPHRGLYTSLALSACHCYASFVPLISCVFMPMFVYNICMSKCATICAFYIPYVCVYSVLSECVCNCFLPRPGSSLCLSIVSSVVFSGSRHLAAIEDNAEQTIVRQ